MKNLINTASAYLKSVNVANLALAFVAVSLLLLDSSFAQSFGFVDDMAKTVQGLLTGNVGTAISVMGIVGVGIAFLSGRMDWQMALGVAVGIALIKGAVAILGTF